jgi:hypothetical protein
MADLSTNLIHYYPFTSNANDSIPAGTNGSVTNATNVSGGITGNCYSYDGSGDYITYGTTTTPSNLMWGTGTSYSFAFWVNPTHLTGTTNYYFGLVGAYFRHAISVRSNDGRILIGQRSATVSVTKASTFTITAATWSHLAVTYSPTDRLVRLYKNGVYVDNVNVSTVTGDTSYTVAWTSGNLQARIGGNGLDFNGKIDELAFWDRQLNRIEIEALYNKGSGRFYPFTSQWQKKYNKIVNIGRVNKINVYDIKKINKI